MGWKESERERKRNLFGERRGVSKRQKKGERGRKSNESKYNVKGYLIVSTLYPRLG